MENFQKKSNFFWKNAFFCESKANNYYVNNFLEAEQIVNGSRIAEKVGKLNLYNKNSFSVYLHSYQRCKTPQQAQQYVVKNGVLGGQGT